MESLRRTFGIAEPVRRGMELKIAGAGEWRPQVLGGPSSVHSDILAGRDCEIGWEDVFVGECDLVLPVSLGDTGRVGEIVWERRSSRYRAVLFWKSGKGLVEYIANVFVMLGNELRAVPDFHGEMEARLKMNW